MRNLFLFSCITILLMGCKREAAGPIQEDSTEENPLAVRDFPSHPEWNKKDLFKANDEDYLLESVDEFRTKFDSIMKLNRWDVILGKAVNGKKDGYDIITMPLEKDIEIIVKLDKKRKGITKILLFAEVPGEENKKLIIKAIKGMILSPLNSNHDADDAELILHQVSLLNMYQPGILQLDGYQYESHMFESKLYFGISYIMSVTQP